MNYVAIFLLVLSTSVFAQGSDIAKTEKLGAIAGYTAEHFNYTLALTEEEDRQASFLCKPESLRGIEWESVGQATVCEGVSKKHDLRIWVGWKKTKYLKLDLARDLAGRILTADYFGSGGVGRYSCNQDHGFAKQLSNIPSAVTDCVLNASSEKEYTFSILYLYPKNTKGLSQWIAVVANKTGRSEQEAVKQELRDLALKIR